MAKYKYIAEDGKNIAVQIKEDDDGNAITDRTIVFMIDAVGNTDYENWKAWEAKGNTTEAAD
jgi:hypothetical protein